MRSRKDESNWISISDMMTGLMVVFMFIAINYIMQVIEYKFVEQDVYNALSEEFQQEIEEQEIQLSPDGTVTFNPADKVLFRTGSNLLTSDFHEILDDFIPRYLQTITTYGNLDYIKEIRIEGHTDTVPPRSGMDSYSYNLALSSSRAQSVLEKVRGSHDFLSLELPIKKRLEFLLTANGMSYSRALNSEGEVVYTSENKAIDNDKSRRVEFRIVTSSEKLVKEIYDEQDL
ncbi:OmpA family protein [uncultured Imperialibacter sp.]|uniref:OmpA/MotB family protein n=1 Tax=uncultured Imperialibacter sp. TaxID=1672639 RepID=UPI0030DBDC32|tara:strand:- start:15931 stop:16623 length:693 start_codon:yes stop_codon:yes gene_type:complete